MESPSPPSLSLSSLSLLVLFSVSIPFFPSLAFYFSLSFFNLFFSRQRKEKQKENKNQLMGTADDLPTGRFVYTLLLLFLPSFLRVLFRFSRRLSSDSYSVLLSLSLSLCLSLSLSLSSHAATVATRHLNLRGKDNTRFKLNAAGRGTGGQSVHPGGQREPVRPRRGTRRLFPQLGGRVPAPRQSINTNFTVLETSTFPGVR